MWKCENTQVSNTGSSKINIFWDLKALETIKMKSRPLYEKAWSKFRDFFPCSLEFDTRIPSEEEFSTYFRFLRQDKGFSTSTLWTTYSMLNSVSKGKYSKSLQQYPRLQSIIKAFDVDVKKKAHIFTNWRICQKWDSLRSILACSESLGYYRIFRRTPPHWGHKLGSGKNQYWTRRSLCGSWTCQTKIRPTKFQVIFNIINIVV